MKITFTCEICGEDFDDYHACQGCEAQGRIDLAQAPPIGTIVSGKYDLKSFTWVIQHRRNNGHKLDLGFGVFRGNDRGDSFYFHENAHDPESPRVWFGHDQFRLGPDYYEKKMITTQSWGATNTNLDSFKRAVAAVKKAGLVPFVIDEDGLWIPYRSGK